MIQTDQYLDRLIDQKLMALNKLERDNHVASGKLTASMLGWPLQWQILKVKGIAPKPMDGYTLRKMLRGNQIEDWIVTHMDAIKTQKFVEYKDAIGYADAIVISDKWDFKNGMVAHEVKSVTNMKYKRIQSSRDADPQHKLQGALYALGLGLTHYAIDYVASDDLRITTFVYKAEDLRGEIDNIIEKFNEAVKADKVPVFQAKYKWQENIIYNMYPDWMSLTEAQISDKLKALLK